MSYFEKFSKMKRFFLYFLAFLLIWGCPNGEEPISQQQTDWLERPVVGFENRYELEEIVVLSRHNIRTPMVGKGSVLSRLTDPANQWFEWTDAPSHLTSKGMRLETQMGSFFRLWLTSRGLIDKYSADNSSFRFYANAKERCQTTAKQFAAALLPGSAPEVEMKVAFDTMDPVFNPQITKLPEGFEEKARAEIASKMGDLDKGIATQYALIEKVIGLTRAPAYPDTSSFAQFPSSVGFKLNAEPFMTGGLKMACSVSDALVLQYYEEPDEMKAAFGRKLQNSDWINIGLVKEWYGEALFTAPSVAVNVAHPLLQTMLSELQNDNRAFSFLCGHDSNIGSVLAALEVKPYDLPSTIEKKTPIGAKLVIEKFKHVDGEEFVDLWLIYASTEQLRDEQPLTYSRPPVAVRLELEDMTANGDGLYSLSDLEARFASAIEAYDAL